MKKSIQRNTTNFDKNVNDWKHVPSGNSIIPQRKVSKNIIPSNRINGLSLDDGCEII